MKMREFERHDWDGYSGAELGPLGENPQIGIQTIYELSGPTHKRASKLFEVTVIADNGGVEISYWSEEDDKGQKDYSPAVFRIDGPFYFAIWLASKLEPEDLLNIKTDERHLGFLQIAP